MRVVVDWLMVTTLFLWPVLAWAQALPMVARASLLNDRAVLIDRGSRTRAASPSLFGGGMVDPLLVVATPLSQPPAASAAPAIASRSPSLFAGDGMASLFSSAPPISRPDRTDALPSVDAPHPSRRMAALRSLIAQAEAGVMGYNAVQHGARIQPPQAPTRLTVQQIYDWIDATPGQPHAIGRYQFIPATLRRLMRHQGVDPRTPFTPALQDRLADQLLAEAGLRRFLAGDLSRKGFMNNLAKIWAGLPTHTGKSHYHGYAGNKATMTWARFDNEMARIFPG